MIAYTKTTHLGLLALLLILTAFTSGGNTSTPAATFTVTATGDAGDDDVDDGICATAGGVCTLRAAIMQANKIGGAHTIAFALGAGFPTIAAGSGFPEITATLTIDGATGGATKVEIAGPGAGPGPGSDSGLFFTSGGNTVMNLIIHSFDGSGLIFSTATGNTLEGCWIGLDKTGGPASNAAAGLFLDGSSDNMLGGATPDKMNVLDAVIFGFGSSGNTFEGNFVGTTTDGTGPLDTGGGLSFVFGSNSNTIIRNVISGSGGNGISILFGSAENEFIDNLIGTDVSGTVAIPNAADGVHIADGHFNLFLGNIISGNGAPTTDCASIGSCDGIDIRSGSSGNVVNSNHIGVDATGTVALGNRDHGAFLGDGASSNAIGDPGAPSPNIISGNGRTGVELVDGTTVGNSVAGNHIGIDIAGAPIPNGAHGVLIRGAVSNFIGGTDPGAGNKIAFNDGNGVTVEAGESNTIRGNAITDNMGLGIDLGDPGPTPNDPGDGDDGANKLQNHPLITSVEPGGGTTLAGFILNSKASTTYAVDFYAVGMPDPSGFGEGEVYLGTETVTTNPAGTVSGFFSASGTYEHITATATDPVGNTSEFSNRVTFFVNSTANDKDMDPSDGLCHTGFFITRDFIAEPECTLRAAIEHVTANPSDKEIKFNIPVDDDGCDNGVCTITPDAQLPFLTVPMMTLDAFSQPGACSGGKDSCMPKIVLDGSDAGTGENAHGLQAKAVGVAIRGFVIQNYAGHGILIEGISGVSIQGNYIGTNAAGTAAAKNERGGIWILNAAGNMIGGEEEDDRNVISGNGEHGIQISGAPAQRNEVWGNFIGTDATGTQALGNDEAGVRLIDGAHDNEIGGTETGQRNIISGNDVGVEISKGGGTNQTKDNNVWGNFIGLDATGMVALRNATGVSITDATGSSIGGIEEEKRNIISGNGTGIRISGKETTDNAILGNYIGTDKEGACTLDAQNLCPLGNSSGVSISNAPSNRVGGAEAGSRNVIAGNGTGVVIIGEDASGNTVHGNFIGTDKTGLARLSNSTGISINDAPDNEIGGVGDALRNIISSSFREGVFITGSKASGNTVAGNVIGLNKDGTCEEDGSGFCALRNTTGVSIFGDAHDNVIGGTDEGAGNVISGNLGAGLRLEGDKTEKNTVAGNVIGLAVDGDALMGNQEEGIYLKAPKNIIGGPGENEGNIISGNIKNGIYIDGVAGNKVQGNFIGTDETGKKARGNGLSGIFLTNIIGDEDVIGGLREAFGEQTCAPPCNIIAANGTAEEENDNHGIYFENTRGIAVQGNLIGAGIDGAELGNSGHGLYVFDSSFNLIGQDAFTYDPARNGLGNVIAYNGGHGVQVAESGDATSRENSILSNRIFENNSLGIDLKAPNDPATGVTANDPALNADNDDGVNALQNFPDLVEVTRKDATTMTIALGFPFGTDPGRRGRKYIFEYFASPMQDPSEHGEGRRFVAGRAPEIPSNHNLAMPFGFSLDVPLASILCSFLSLTATDDDGNTSEFSRVKANLVGCLDIVKIEFEHRLRSGVEMIEEGWTVDGNVVKINIHVRNGGDGEVKARVKIRERVDNIDIIRPGAPSTNLQTFPAGETTVISFDWDTMGYAWKRFDATPLSDRMIEVTLLNPDDDGEVDQEEEAITVRPRPVVLVPGFLMGPDSWTLFKERLGDPNKGGRSDWQGFAVGDGEAEGLMTTGFRTVSSGQIAVPVSHLENASVLNIYVEGIRDKTKAAHIDLVAHSSGGLAARQYITSRMMTSPAGDEKPVATNLITLGTPHLGTTCTNRLFDVVTLPLKVIDLLLKGKSAAAEALIEFTGTALVPALEKLVEDLAQTQGRNLYEMTTEFVQKKFNPAQQSNEVPFYFYGTRAFPFACKITHMQGDGFVTTGSALANAKNHAARRFPDAPLPEKTKLDRGGFHFTLPRDLGAFVFARSVIDVYPGEAASDRGDGDIATAKTASSASDAATQQQEAEQVVAAFSIPVPRGEMASFDLQVPEVTAFGLLLVVGDAVATTLRNPAGVVVDEALASDSTRRLMRSHRVGFPEAGAWSLDLVNHSDRDTVFVPVIAWMQGNPFQVEAQIRTPDIEGRVHLVATVTDEDLPVDDALVVARLLAVEATDTLTVDLLDDGLHGDGDAGDGVYGAEVSPSQTGPYAVSVWAVRGDRVASMLQFVDLQQGAGSDLALDVTASTNRADLSVPITFTHTIINQSISPADGVALDAVLPDGVTFEEASASVGSCSATDDVVTCALGTVTIGTAVTVTITVVPNANGVLIHEATVVTDGADWNPSNNTTTSVVVVGTPTATEAETGVPDEFALHPNYPNPFNPQTEIRYDVKAATHVVVEVFNAVGQPIETLVDAPHAPGRYSTTFDAAHLPSGVYFYRIQAGVFQAVRQMVLVK